MPAQSTCPVMVAANARISRHNDALANTAPTPSTDRWTETLINQISQ